MQRPEPISARRPVRGLRRVLLLFVGCLALVMGSIGIVLPLLPATPLMLLAAACFAASWPAMHHRLANSSTFGSMLRNPDDRYLPVRTKVGVIGFTLVSIAATAVFVVDTLWLHVTLAGIALIVSFVIVRIPSGPREV